MWLSGFLNTIYLSGSFPHCVVLPPVSRITVYFWAFCSVDCVSVFMPVLSLCSTSQVGSRFLHLCFLKSALAIWSLLWFHTHFRIVCSSSVKNVMDRNLIWMALNLCIAVGSADILIKLFHSVREHGISFHFFVSSSISFMDALWFSEYWLFTSSVKFYPKYFILLVWF